MRGAVAALPVAQRAEADPERRGEFLLRKPGLLAYLLNIDLGRFVNLDACLLALLMVNGFFHPFFYALEDVAHNDLPLMLDRSLHQNAGQLRKFLTFAIGKVVLLIFSVERQEVKRHFFIVVEIDDTYPAALPFAPLAPAQLANTSRAFHDSPGFRAGGKEKDQIASFFLR